MKRKRAALILPLLLMIAFLPAAFADVETLESNFFYSDETFEVHDKIGTVKINSLDQVILNYDNHFIVLYNNTCRTEYIYTRFCIEDVRYDVSEHKYETKLSIYYIGPDIKIERSVNVSNPQIGEGVKITVTLRNDGNASASNITYIDVLPPEIEVIKVKGIARAEKVSVWGNDTGWQNMTRIFWQGPIGRGEKEEFYYTVKPVAALDTKLVAKAVYFNGIKDITVYSSELNLKTEYPFDLKSIFVEKDYEVAAGEDVTGGETIAEAEVGKEILFIIELKSKVMEDHALNATLEFYFPDGLQYVSSPMIRVRSNTSDPTQFYLAGALVPEKISRSTYRWKGSIPENFSKVFVFKVRAEKKGVKRATIIGSFSELDEDDNPLYSTNYYDYKDIDLTFNDITLESNFNDGDSFDSGQKTYFTVWLQNPNEYTNITRIKALMNMSWLPEKEISFDTVKKAAHINIFDGFVDMPAVKSAQARKFSVNVTYETPYGEVFNKVLQRSVTIKPHSVIDITHNIEDATAINSYTYDMDSKENYVTITLSNKADRYIEHVDFQVVIDPRLVKAGDDNFSKVISVDKSAVVDVYKFKIDPPEKGKLENYTIKVYVNYTLDDISYSAAEDIILLVKPKKLEIDISKDLFEEDAIMGRIASIDYTLENTEKETLYNLTIVFPFTYGVDIVGNRVYSIDILAPDEKIDISRKEAIRPKINGTVKLEKTGVVFHDIYGNEFVSNSSMLSIDVIYAEITSPALFLVKNISKTTVNKSEEFEVSLLINNTGPKEAYIKVEDDGKNWTLGVGAGKKNSITYKTKVENVGKVGLPMAVASLPVAVAVLPMTLFLLPVAVFASPITLFSVPPPMMLLSPTMLLSFVMTAVLPAPMTTLLLAVKELSFP